MNVLKKLAILTLICFGISSEVFACEPILEAWDAENHQGEPYSFGLHCEANNKTFPFYFGSKPWPDNFISSIKVHHDFVLRACDGSKMKGACVFIMGEVANLAHYRPTGVNFNNIISSFKLEYQAQSEITIEAFYDAPDPNLNPWREYHELLDTLAHVEYEVGLIRKAFASSGLNIRVHIDYHAVSEADANTIYESLDALGTFISLYGKSKKDHTYGLYFPKRDPVDSTNSLNKAGDDADSNWWGIAAVDDAKNEEEHGKFLTRRGFGIVVPRSPADTGAHEWGHLAGLGHKKNDGYTLPYGTGHFGSFGSHNGAPTFSSIMNGYLGGKGNHTLHLVFSSPQIDCNVQITSYFALTPSCGKEGESDARSALLETILQWHQQ